MCPSFFRLHSYGENPEAREYDCSGCIERGAVKQKHLVCHEKCSTGKCKYFNRNCYIRKSGSVHLICWTAETTT